VSDRAIYLVVARGVIDNDIKWIAYWANKSLCEIMTKALQKEHDAFDEWHDDYMRQHNGRHPELVVARLNRERIISTTR
jgi:hypothetical protein